MRDWIATGLMVASLPVSLAVALSTMAATASLHVTGVASPGTVISVQGSAMPRNQRLVLAWDGSTAGMPTVRADKSGSFTTSLTVPASATIGSHVLAAETTVKGGGRSNKTTSVVASLTVQVVAASASPTATPRVTPTPTPTLRATPTPTPTLRATPTPTPTPAPTQSGSASVDHVFVVVMENHAANEVYNTSATPYTTSLANRYARAANYFAITHPSLPNYLDLYAGSNYGITTDCNPSSTCHSTARSLADNVEAKGLSWKGYFESMSTPCQLTDSGTYRAHHNPFIYFDAIRLNATRCDAHVVNASALATDLASRTTTPNFALYVPNNCDNTHDCSIATGDTWLSTHIPPILNSPACTVDTCLVALTWDEDDGSQGNQVLTVFAGSAAKLGVVSSVRYDHFDLLRTVESLLGVPTQTTNDGSGTRMSDLLK